MPLEKNKTAKMRLSQNLLATIAILLFTFFYFSFNSYAQRLPEEPLRFHKNYTKNGLIFGNITFPNEKMRFDNYNLLLNCINLNQKLRKKNSNKIRIDSTMFIGKHYRELQAGTTYLFVMEKETGQYDISSVKFTTFKLFDHAPQYDYVSGFSIPFNISKGEITYIGEININEYALKSETVTTLTDQFERDKNAVKERFKMGNWDLAIKSKLELNDSDNDFKRL